MSEQSAQDFIDAKYVRENPRLTAVMRRLFWAETSKEVMSLVDLAKSISALRGDDIGKQAVGQRVKKLEELGFVKRKWGYSPKELTDEHILGASQFIFLTEKAHQQFKPDPQEIRKQKKRARENFNPQDFEIEIDFDELEN